MPAAETIAAARKAIQALSAARSKTSAGDSILGKAIVAVFAVFLIIIMIVTPLTWSLVPMGMWQTAFATGVVDDDAAEEVWWYVNKAEELEDYANAKYPNAEIVVPDWRWLYALDMAASENDFDAVKKNEATFDALHRSALKVRTEITTTTKMEPNPDYNATDAAGAALSGVTYDISPTIEVTVNKTYTVVSYKSFDVVLNTLAGASGSLSDAFKYFAKYESGQSYDQGFSSGDGYHAMGYYQFDNRYNLQPFLQYCYDYDSTTFSVFKPFLDTDISSSSEALENAWHTAFAANPAVFSSLQDEYEYETKYLPAQDYLASIDIDISNRPDCIKGLICGVYNLFGSGGWRRFVGGTYGGAEYAGCKLTNSMSDSAFATTLCNYIIAYCPGNFTYGDSYANRYRCELQDVLSLLINSDQGNSTSISRSGIGTIEDAAGKIALAKNYYKALKYVSVDKWAHSVSFDKDGFAAYITTGMSSAASDVPIYYQYDPQWADMYYATGTIKHNGCGLTSAAMAFSTLTRIEITPADLNDMVGDSCSVAGNNDMGAFCHYAANKWGLQHSEQYTSLDEALRDVEDGKLVFVSVHGNINGQYSTAGHIMLIYKVDGDDIWIRDPNSEYNTDHPFCYADLISIYKYFYTIWK